MHCILLQCCLFPQCQPPQNYEIYTCCLLHKVRLANTEWTPFYLQNYLLNLCSTDSIRFWKHSSKDFGPHCHDGVTITAQPLYNYIYMYGSVYIRLYTGRLWCLSNANLVLRGPKCTQEISSTITLSLPPECCRRKASSYKLQPRVAVLG